MVGNKILKQNINSDISNVNTKREPEIESKYSTEDSVKNTFLLVGPTNVHNIGILKSSWKSR